MKNSTFVATVVLASYITHRVKKARKPKKPPGVVHYVFHDVVLPAAKEMTSDVITMTVERTLYSKDVVRDNQRRRTRNRSYNYNLGSSARRSSDLPKPKYID